MAIFIKKYGEWVYRGIVLLVLAAFYVGQSRAEYVTRENLTNQLSSAIAPVRSDVATVSVHVTALDKSLAVLAEQNRATDRHEAALKEIDVRLRALETRR